jgi:hypothetical protein
MMRSLALILLLCSSAFCFELRSIPEVSPAAYLKWDIGEAPIQVSLDSRGSADFSLGQSEQALIAALDSWQNVSRQNMRFQYAGTISLQAASNTDRINSVQWVESGWDYSSHTLAVTKYSYYLEDPPTLIDADILINGQNYRWAVTNADNKNRIDIRQALIHELGHLLGISHSSVANAQMFPYLKDAATHSVSIDDRAALRFLYGTGDTSFKLVSPVRKARYVSNISKQGLPLPVFRWRQGPGTDYVLEFSNTSSFKKKIQISVGPYPFYALTPQMENKLLNFSAEDKIYWRVRSGGSISPTRYFTFI